MSFERPAPAQLTQEQIDAAARDLDSMLAKLADTTVDEAERLNIVSILLALPEEQKKRIPPLVRLILEPPDVKVTATCTMHYPDGTPVEPDHAVV